MSGNDLVRRQATGKKKMKVRTLKSSDPPTCVPGDGTVRESTSPQSPCVVHINRNEGPFIRIHSQDPARRQ